MNELSARFKKQAEWQQSRAALSWTEKLRMAEILREAALALGAHRHDTQNTTGIVAESRPGYNDQSH